MSVGLDATLTAIVQFFIATQLQTNHQLIEYIGKAVAREANNITIGNQTLNSERENLHGQIAPQSGSHPQPDLHLINTPPVEWGHAEKVLRK